MTLEAIDWIIIAIYLAGCITAGVWMKRYVRGVTDFAVAGREMDLNLGIASLADSLAVMRTMDALRRDWGTAPSTAWILCRSSRSSRAGGSWCRPRLSTTSGCLMRR